MVCMLNGMCYKFFHVMHLLPMKGTVCVRAFSRWGGKNAKTVNSSPPTYLSPQTEKHTYQFCKEATDPFVLEKESFSLHFAMFSLYLSFTFFLSHLPRILFFPNGFIPCAHTSCLHSALYLCLCKYFRHCTRHKSHFTLYPSFSVLLFHSVNFIFCSWNKSS